MRKLTRTNLKQYRKYYSNIVEGYGCHQDAPDVKRLVTLGYNSGYYGWNWTLYADNVTDTLYVDGYRNY